ncbi:MAG: lipid-A-disaccharide synthase [Myxococcota bacterium]
MLAGERSGDALGARLVRTLHAEVAGVIGPALLDAGVTPLASIDALSLVGLAEIVPRLPRLAALMHRLERDIVAWRPDAVLTIDSPSFTLRLAPRLRARGLRVVHWVAPQVWAWRPHRAARIHRNIDALACLFPFEPALFGPKAVFTGHPAGRAPRSRRPDALGIAAGSRTDERARLGPLFSEAATRLGMPVVEAVPPGLRPVVPHATRVDSVAQLAQHVRFALTASGTSTLELAVAGVPMVVAYQTSALSYALARRLIRVPHLALPNLLLGREVVPELVQDVTVPGLLARLDSLVAREDAVSAALLEVRGLLSPDTALSGVARLLQP